MNQALNNYLFLLISCCGLTGNKNILSMQSEDIRSSFPSAAGAPSPENSPIYQATLAYTFKELPAAELAMLFNRCLHPIHQECARLYLYNKICEHEQEKISCPLCRSPLNYAQLEGISAAISGQREDQLNTFDSYGAEESNALLTHQNSIELLSFLEGVTGVALEPGELELEIDSSD